MTAHWIAERMQHIEDSGIRRIFDLSASMEVAVNLSIGQPHFATPEPVRRALARAVEDGRNGYSPSPGIPPLREALRERVDAEYGHADRDLLVTSGTSGGLMLALCTLVDPGDEVIVFDPYFVMYRHLVTLAGGRTVLVDTNPDFVIDVDRVAAAVTDRTKVIIVNSPNNPTGAVAGEDELRGLATLAAERDIALLSDEIYRRFCYGREFRSPAEFNDRTIVIDGFSKSHSMTGWRLGFAHGPAAVIDQMIKLQQFTFVCAPHPVQWAGLAALDVDVSDHVAEYQHRRDRLRQALADDFEIAGGDGAFYLFARTPWGTGTEFVEAAIRDNLLIIPGLAFSRHDTHFRISYAADADTIERGIEVLKELAKRER